MKKAIVWMMVILTCLTFLTGCGDKKSEEQQAVGEIRQHMAEEAAADGVDLQGMLEQEAAESQARSEARAQQREEKKNTREELDAYYTPLLQAEYDAMIAAATPEETLEHGQRYNELITERFALDKELGVGCSFAGLDAAYIAKALFLASEEYRNYDSWHLLEGGSFSSDWNDVKMVLEYRKENEYGNPYEMVFVKKDLSVCRVDLTGYFAPDIPVWAENYSESAVELCAIENADWNFYLFDITGPEGTLVCKSTDTDEESYRNTVGSVMPDESRIGEAYGYAPYDDDFSVESLNRMVIRHTTGTAAKAYAGY